MCESRGIDRAEVRSLLARLKRKSLLVVDQRGPRTRFRLLETIRLYGEELVEASGEAVELRRAHAEHFESLVGQAAEQWLGPDEVGWMQRIHTELSNVLAAQEFFLAAEQVRRALRLEVNTGRSRALIFEGRINDARDMLSAGLGEQDEVLARRSVEAYRRAELAFLAAGAEGDAFMALMFGAMSAVFHADRETAFAWCTRLLAQAEDARAEWSISWALWTLGLAELLHGSPHEALRLARRVLLIQDGIGDTWGPAWTKPGRDCLAPRRHSAELLPGRRSGRSRSCSVRSRLVLTIGLRCLRPFFRLIRRGRSLVDSRTVERTQAPPVRVAFV